MSNESIISEQEAAEELLARRRARRDPSAFVALVAKDAKGCRVQQGPIHEVMQRHITYAFANDQHAVMLGPPEHGKSVQMLYRLLWEIGKNVNLRIIVVSGGESLAIDRVTTMRSEIVNNKDIQRVFPDLRQPETDSKARLAWGMQAFAVDRDGTAIDPTVQAVALNGSLDGKRADIMLCDDMVTRKDWVSPAARKATIDNWHNTLKKRLGANGRAIFVNNAWHKDDLIHSFRNKEMVGYCTLWLGIPDSCGCIEGRVYHCTAEYVEQVLMFPDSPAYDIQMDGDTCFFRLPLWNYTDSEGAFRGFTQDRLEKEFCENPSSFRRGYGGKAIDIDQMTFPPVEQWAKYQGISDIPGFAEAPIFGFMDGAGGKGKGDYVAIETVVLGGDKRFYLLDCILDRNLPPLDTVRSVYRVHNWIGSLPGRGGHGFHSFKIETNAAQALYLPLFAQVGKDIRMEGVQNWQLPYSGEDVSGTKEFRILALEPDIKNGWLVFPDDVATRWRILCEQFEGYGPETKPAHDDGPDCLASLVALARKTRSGLSGSAPAGAKRASVNAVKDY